MRELGVYLKNLVQLPPVELQRFIGKNFIPSIAEYLDTLYSLLDTYNEEPAEWAEDVYAMIEYIETHIEAPDFFVPLEIRGKYEKGAEGTGKAVREFQILLGKYSDLLTCWPAVWDAALTINRCGG